MTLRLIGQIVTGLGFVFWDIILYMSHKNDYLHGLIYSGALAIIFLILFEGFRF